MSNLTGGDWIIITMWIFMAIALIAGFVWEKGTLEITWPFIITVVYLIFR